MYSYPLKIATNVFGMYIAPRWQHKKIRNSNIEIRNKPGSNKSKSRKSKTSNPIWTRLEFAVFEWF